MQLNIIPNCQGNKYFDFFQSWKRVPCSLTGGSVLDGAWLDEEPAGEWLALMERRQRKAVPDDFS